MIINIVCLIIGFAIGYIVGYVTGKNDTKRNHLGIKKSSKFDI